MIALFERGAEINPILIGEELKKENALEAVGGISFITNLTYGLPHSTNIAHYAKIVRGKSMLRQLIRAANKITQEALEQEDEPEVILDHAEQAIFQLADERIRQGFVHVKPVAEQLLEKIQEMEGRAAVLTGLALAANLLGAMPEAEAALLNSNGKITLLRVHDVRTGWGPPNDHLDVEVVTLHYRGVHGAAASRSGFATFRGSSARTGGSPFDPEHAEDLFG